MKILIAAGGTGGHIYPGIAVAREILRRDATSDVVFVGTGKGLEKKIVPENGFQLLMIHSAGLKNVGAVGKMRGVMLLPRSFWDAARILRDVRPDVVVGAGGYVSGPVLLTARSMGYPTLVMESNALPGFTNRRLARFVDRAALTFEAAMPFFGKKGVVTGNPVRREFFDIAERLPGDPLRILIFGGSQGARAINRAMIAALPILKDAGCSLVIEHQTGEADYDTVREGYADAGWADAEIMPYISDMVGAFDRADLIISRAGATSCAEVAAAGKPAVMIPFPGAADDHQRKNAEAFVQAGASEMILQSQLTDQRLAELLIALSSDRDRLRTMGLAARKLAHPDAAAQTVDIIEELSRA